MVVACQNKIDRPDAILSQEQRDRINAESATQSSAAGSVFHYICPNGHNQGGDGAGTCPECGAELIHNQAYHSQAPSSTGTINPTDAAATSAGGVQHYICPNGHDHGAPGMGTCPECGAEFIHNQAYHNNQTTATPSTSPGTSVTVPPATSSTEPAQNASGVWHYICPNGHAGGAGSATACGECGTTLVHNSAYHN